MAVYPGHFGSYTVIDEAGNRVPYATVHLFDDPIARNHVPLYYNIGRAALPNPMTANARGYVSLWAEPGDYWIAQEVDGVVQIPEPITVHTHPRELLPGTSCDVWPPSTGDATAMLQAAVNGCDSTRARSGVFSVAGTVTIPIGHKLSLDSDAVIRKVSGGTTDPAVVLEGGSIESNGAQLIGNGQVLGMIVCPDGIAKVTGSHCRIGQVEIRDGIGGSGQVGLNLDNDLDGLNTFVSDGLKVVGHDRSSGSIGVRSFFALTSTHRDIEISDWDIATQFESQSNAQKFVGGHIQGNNTGIKAVPDGTLAGAQLITLEGTVLEANNIGADIDAPTSGEATELYLVQAYFENNYGTRPTNVKLSGQATYNSVFSYFAGADPDRDLVIVAGAPLTHVSDRDLMSSGVTHDGSGTLTIRNPRVPFNPTGAGPSLQLLPGDHIAWNLAAADYSMFGFRSLLLGQHLILAGGSPNIVEGPAAGVSPSVAISGGDSCGLLSVTCGASGTTPGVLVTITFTTPFATAPRVFLQTYSGGSETLYNADFYVAETTTGFTINAGTAPTVGIAYGWNYLVIGT